MGQWERGAGVWCCRAPGQERGKLVGFGSQEFRNGARSGIETRSPGSAASLQHQVAFLIIIIIIIAPVRNT